MKNNRKQKKKRGRPVHLDFSATDWRKPNWVIAAERGYSSMSVLYARRKAGKPKASECWGVINPRGRGER